MTTWGKALPQGLEGVGLLRVTFPDAILVSLLWGSTPLNKKAIVATPGQGRVPTRLFQTPSACL